MESVSSLVTGYEFCCRHLPNQTMAIDERNEELGLILQKHFARLRVPLILSPESGCVEIGLTSFRRSCRIGSETGNLVS